MNRPIDVARGGHTSRALLPGPLPPDLRLALWPRLRPAVIEAIRGQDEDVRELMVLLLKADASQLTFMVSEQADEIVVALGGVQFCGVPVLALMEPGESTEAH